MKPIVTIGLCVKNNEDTVKEVVNSIVDQDYPHEIIEVIVVDGCSQDKTLSIIREELSKSDLKVRFFSENKGLGFARQLVVDNAAGKYIVWVDGDVILTKSYITLQVRFMEQNPSVAIAAGSFGLLQSDNCVAILESIGYAIESIRNKGKPTSNLIGTRGSIFRTEAVRMAGGFDTNIRGSQEDTDLAFRIYSAGWKFYITDAIFCERQKGTWRAVWKKNIWYGYGLHYVKHKNKGLNMFIHRTNDRILISLEAYKLTYRKAVFLLPLNFIFKKTALFFGFLKAHMDGYGHN